MLDFILINIFCVPGVLIGVINELFGLLILFSTTGIVFLPIYYGA